MSTEEPAAAPDVEAIGMRAQVSKERFQKVWVVYEEFQADSPDVIGIYESKEDAERAAEECRQEARQDYGWVVYGDEDEGGRTIAEWDVDVHVEGHRVQ